jgi:hypothetical protein
MPSRLSSSAALLAWGTFIALALPPSTAHATVFSMPTGGTSWIEVSSNACDLGTPANGADCFGAERTLPEAEYSREAPSSLRASGQVLPDRITLSNVGSQGGGGGFVWGATGGLFTLHGGGNAPVTVTATVAVEGTLSRGHTTTFTGASWKIGTWAFGDVASDLNFRVGPVVQDSFNCSFNQCAAGSVAFTDLLSFSVAVLPGQSFNLGYQLTTSTQSLSASLGPASVLLSGRLSISAGDGFFIVGDNGYDSRVAAVPEPETYALMLAGLAVVGWGSRRRLVVAGTSRRDCHRAI